MWQGLKSVMVFEPRDNQSETNEKWREWMKHKSSVGDTAVPTVEQTREYLKKQENSRKRYA